MTIKARTEYAYWALLDLALHGDGRRPVKLTEISARRRISEKFLLQVMSSLKQAGLVASVRGQQGGYLLARQPAQITLADIFRASGVEPAVTAIRQHAPAPAAHPSSSFLPKWIARSRTRSKPSRSTMLLPSNSPRSR